MNDNHQPSDELLQFLFGELNDSREAAVRKAVAEDAELAAIAQSLASAVAAVRAENVGQVSDDFNDRLRRRMPPAENCPTGGPDSLSIGAAKPQEALPDDHPSSRACGTPIDKLSGLHSVIESATFLRPT
jgi:anti-sigma factor RsiW